MLVTVLVYSFMPLMMSVPSINAWIRAERSCSVNKMHPISQLLDQGLQMFAVKEANFTKKDIPKNILELDKLRDINYDLRNELRTVAGKTRSVSISSPGLNSPNESKSIVHTTTKEAETLLNAKAKPCSTSNNNLDSNGNGSGSGNPEGCGHLTMAVKHFVRWEFIHDFEKWTGNIYI